MTETVARALAAQIAQESTHVEAKALQRPTRNGELRKSWSVQLTLKSHHQLTKAIENSSTWSSLKDAWNVLVEVQA